MKLQDESLMHSLNSTEDGFCPRSEETAVTGTPELVFGELTGCIESCFPRTVLGIDFGVSLQPSSPVPLAISSHDVDRVLLKARSPDS